MSYLMNMENLKLSAKKTIIANIETHETVDTVALDKLLTSDLLKTTFNNKFMEKIYESEHQQLIKFKSMIDENNDATVKHKKKSAYGRSVPKLGLFLIRRQIRQTLVKDLYVDIDMENCHVVILQQICKMNNIKTPMLDDYVDNRETHLKMIIDKYDTCRDEAKRVFLIAMYCGNFDIKGQKEPEFYKKLIKETRGIAVEVAKANPQIVKIVEDKNFVNENEYVKNKNGKVLSLFLQEIEHQCLNEMFKYCKSKGYIENNNCSLQADGIMIKKNKYKSILLINLNKHIKKTIGLDINFTRKEMKDDYLNILDEHVNKREQPKIINPLPELSHKPDVVGCDKYLSNMFTYDMYKNNDIIVLQSCCGTGKTYSVSKYIADSNDKVISIINRKSLLVAQIKEFNDKGVELNNYENKDTYDLNENGIICINSIMKYARQSDEHFKNFVIYIDEINSFLETITHSHILTKDIKLVYETLTRILKNCKKIIMSDHQITDAVFHLFRSIRKNKKVLYVKNNFLKFKGVHSEYIKNEKKYKNRIENTMKEYDGFFAGFDSAHVATLYYNELKHKTERDCILVTDETRVKIPHDLSVWEGKYIFYSPKIETGVDFNIDTKQPVFFHMKGKSVLPTSSFQMICRTRNMESLTWYAAEPEDKYKNYDSLNDACNKILEQKKNTNLYMCSSYLNEDDELTYAPNSFYNMYIFNEYIRDIYEHDKIEMLKLILNESGFICNEDDTETPEKLDKVTKEKMENLTEKATDKTFDDWINKDIECEMFDIRSAMLGLKDDDDKKKYREHITDKYKYNDHFKIIDLLKDENYINSKAENALSNSYVEFGIDNIKSKIKLLYEFEKQANIKRFDFTEINDDCDIDDTTWIMIKKIFRKSTEKPKNAHAIKKVYVSMINNIVELYASERMGKKKVQIYKINLELIKQAVELDSMRTSLSNPRKNYDENIFNGLGLELPDDNNNFVLIDDEFD